jgi:putative spermidine/putrescine transport system ATP-binding protein
MVPADPDSTARGGAATSRAAVRLESVTKRFGAVTAVDDLDLEIRDGEFFSMLGPSGSGKTTVLRMIAGFEAPTSGTIWLDGQDVTKQAPFQRNVNTVFQDYALFPHLDVLGNVEYGLAVKKVPRKQRRERAMYALESVQLGGYGDRKPSQLSGGQRQRVALARALVNLPKVLLLDEPLGALDLKLRREMQIELKQLQREVGITFVFVTHDQEEALTMSDRIAVFHDGRVEQVAAPAQLYESPASSFVAGFVGTSNLLSGEVARVIIGREGMYSIRPEKIHLVGTEEAAGLPARATGVIDAVVYLGSVNHYVVQLDEGGTLTVLRQNLHGASDQRVVRTGDRVALSWAAEHLIDLTPSTSATATSVGTSGSGHHQEEPT